MDETRRRDKLDDALLFVMGSIGILFGLIQVFVGFSTLLQFVFPVGLLGWGLPFYFGHVRGALRDSMVDRYRGWIFLVVGLVLYSFILAEEELSSLIKDPGLQWILPVGGAPLLILFVLGLARFRRFVLGPTFPSNQVISQAAFDTVRAAGVIAFFGAIFAIAKFQTVSSLYVAIPLIAIAALIVAPFMLRSNSYARKANLRYRIVEKRGRYRGNQKVERAAKVLTILSLAFAGTGAVITIVARYSGVEPALLFFAGGSLLGWGFILFFPTIVLSFLTRKKEVIDFEGPFPEEPQVNHPI